MKVERRDEGRGEEVRGGGGGERRRDGERCFLMLFSAPRYSLFGCRE